MLKIRINIIKIPFTNWRYVNTHIITRKQKETIYLYSGFHKASIRKDNYLNLSPKHKLSIYTEELKERMVEKLLNMTTIDTLTTIEDNKAIGVIAYNKNGPIRFDPDAVGPWVINIDKLCKNAYAFDHYYLSNLDTLLLQLSEDKMRTLTAIDRKSNKNSNKIMLSLSLPCQVESFNITVRSLSTRDKDIRHSVSRHYMKLLKRSLPNQILC